MIVTYRDLENGPQTSIKEKWLPARPLNYQYRSFFERIREAWLVFTGKCDPFLWPENDWREPILIEKDRHDEQETRAAIK